MRRTSATGRGPNGGFTLLELMVVLAIVILMVSAFPMLLSGRFLDRRRVAAEAERVRALLLEAKAESAVIGVSGRVTVSGRTMFVAYGRGPDISSFNRSYATEANLSLGAALTAESGPVILYPDGSSNGGVIGVARGAARSSVVVSPLTGRIVVERPL
jgi:prepilin-type N-terminal cleavage/methylation domain-containing protein